MASTAASQARVRAVASGPTSPQQRTTQGQRGAGSQACRMGARVPSVPMGVHVRVELLSPGQARRAETPPPLGFNFNHRVNYIPCIITNSDRRGVPARYTSVIMGPDPHIIGIIPGDLSCSRLIFSSYLSFRHLPTLPSISYQFPLHHKPLPLHLISTYITHY